MTLRIGILGAAAIAPKALVEPANGVDGVEVTAIAARDPERAKAFADEHGIAQVEADYTALCHSDHVDAVYVALPASHHHRWSIEALTAGKDVLCEKPIASNAVEAAEMVAVADETGQLLMEAYHWRYHPLAARMKELADTRIGTLESVTASFTVPIPWRDNIRYQPELAGGALMDLGCYPLQWVRFIVGGEPTVASAGATQDPEGIDVSLTALLHFHEPRHAHGKIHCSMADDAERGSSLSALGSDGAIHVTNPIAPQLGNRIELVTDQGTETETIESESTYHHQLVAFASAVETRIAPPTSGQDSIATMAVIDDCYRAADMQPRGMTES